MSFDADNPKDEEEAEAVEMTRGAAEAIEEAIFLTMTAAVSAVEPMGRHHSHRELRSLRTQSKDAWRDVADKLLGFAAHDD